MCLSGLQSERATWDADPEKIRRELDREPDAGDLLLVLTTGPDSVSAVALEQLDVDHDQLWAQIVASILRQATANTSLTTSSADADSPAPRRRSA